MGGGPVFHWDGRGDATRRLMEVGRREKGVKPEILLMIGEGTSAYRVVVMHDGVPGGSPIEYRLPK